MAVLDKPMSSVVSAVLGALGPKGAGKVYLRPTDVSTYNPTSGQETTSSPTDVLVKSSPPAPYSIQEINGTSILKDDYRLLVYHKTHVPILTDLVVIGSTIYRIIEIHPISTGDENVCYELQIRR